MFFLVIAENNTDIYMHMIKIMDGLVGCAAEKLRTNVDEGAMCITTSVLCCLVEVKLQRYPKCQCFLVKWQGNKKCIFENL